MYSIYVYAKHIDDREALAEHLTALFTQEGLRQVHEAQGETNRTEQQKRIVDTFLDRCNRAAYDWMARRKLCLIDIMMGEPAAYDVRIVP